MGKKQHLETPRSYQKKGQERTFFPAITLKRSIKGSMGRVNNSQTDKKRNYIEEWLKQGKAKSPNFGIS